MDEKDLLASAGNQLDRVLGFFSRVEAKASVVFAVNMGMLAFMASRVPSFHLLSWWEIGIPAATMTHLGASFWFLYKGAFPNLKGGNSSLVYFREIAARTETKFVDEFTKQTKADHAKDLLAQAWRNSEMLKHKFDCLKMAFIFLAFAIPLWVVSLAVFSLKTTATATP